MILKTSAIVLRRINYGDSSIIVQLYSQEFGLFASMVRGARKSKKSLKTNVFEPFSLVDLVVYKKENHQMATVKECKPTHHLNSIRSNIYKTTIALFCAEVLQKTLKEEVANPAQFLFLNQAILWLELAEKNFANFPLAFLSRFTLYLGFLPTQFNGEYFDFVEGEFVNQLPPHKWFVSGVLAQTMSAFFQNDFDSTASLKLNQEQRRILLREIIRFYSLHIEELGQLKSQEILEQVLG